MKRLTTYKLKLKPTVEQKIKLNRWIGVCRFVYNRALHLRKEAYDQQLPWVSKSELQLVVKNLAKETEWMQEVQSQVLQDPLVRLENAYSAFFKAIKRGDLHGPPVFAKKQKYKSFPFPQGVVLRENGKLFLPKFGEMSFFKGKRDIQSMQIKQAKIIKQIDGWFVCLTGYVEAYHLEKNTNYIGIDLGVANYLVTSDGQFVDNPTVYKNSERKLRLIHRSIARKKKGSKRREKEKVKLSKVWNEITNKRIDFQHKLSTKLISENQGIAVEQLEFRNMMSSAKGTKEDPGKNVRQKAGLNRSLADISGYRFFGMLEYKAKQYGREFVKVNPRCTSQTCTECGHVDADNRLSQAQFYCIKCGYKSHADLVASINVKGRAFPSGHISGVTCEPEKPRLQSVRI